MNSIMIRALEPIAEIMAEVAVPRFDELLEQAIASHEAYEKEWGVQVRDKQAMEIPEKQENTRQLIRGETARKAGKIERRQAKIRLDEAVKDAVKKLSPERKPE